MSRSEKKRNNAGRCGFVIGIYSYEDLSQLWYAPGFATKGRKKDLRDWAKALIRGRQARNVYQR